MAKLPDTMVQILSASGGIIVDAKPYPPELLLRMAGAAAKGGGTLILRNADSKIPETLVQLAAAGKGRVIMEL